MLSPCHLARLVPPPDAISNGRAGKRIGVRGHDEDALGIASDERPDERDLGALAVDRDELDEDLVCVGVERVTHDVTSFTLRLGGGAGAAAPVVADHQRCVVRAGFGAIPAPGPGQVAGRGTRPADGAGRP